MNKVLMNEVLMIINGERCKSSNGDVTDVLTPSVRNKVIAKVPRATEQDVNHAINAAERAFISWKRVTPRERGEALWAIATKIEERAEEIAKLVALETGNAIRTQARTEVKSVIDIFKYFAGVVMEIKGYTNPIVHNLISYTQREPYGVVGAIVPWNAPIQLTSLKIAPAIAAGNTIVLKAAENAPLAVLEIGQICNEFLPPGVVNIITGPGKTCGDILASHPSVKKLTFTGSTGVGKQIMHRAADRIAPVSLELGGKSPQIVFADADQEKLIDGIVTGMRFARQGQSCSAGSRVYIHEDIFDEVVQKLKVKIEQLVVGDPLDEKSDLGCMISEAQFNKVYEYIEEGINDTALELVTGGLPPKEGWMTQGYYHIPTLFICHNDDCRLSKEEIFGPVLLVSKWSTYEEVIERANNSDYGLAAYVWTENLNNAYKTVNDLEAGWIQVNRGLAQMPGLAYGGYKQSGIGREFALEGMLESYTQLKSVMIELKP